MKTGLQRMWVDTESREGVPFYWIHPTLTGGRTGTLLGGVGRICNLVQFVEGFEMEPRKRELLISN
jgi:hypothetical protein